MIIHIKGRTKSPFLFLKKLGVKFCVGCDADDITVTIGYDVTLNITIVGADDKDEETTSVTVAKVDGGWCIFDDGLSSIL